MVYIYIGTKTVVLLLSPRSRSHLGSVVVPNLGVESRHEHEGGRHDFLDAISAANEKHQKTTENIN